MAFDAFLKIDSIQGESTDELHPGWFELFSFSWGAAQPVSTSRTDGGGATIGKPSPQPFSFVKATDTASPALFLKMCTGTNLRTASLACRNAGGGDDFIKIDFFDVIISTYNEGGTTATDPRPLESISFVFGKVTIQAATISPEGLVGAFSGAGFDFEANRAIPVVTGG